ncbi:hypothetical protein ANN_19271 [Periplaneta americana]|uniref:Uncharacterized protein n=1 Tax=Periplaneta americana TaxID=6978 RepID=A0ABQ8SAC7_PERAM|nr:hypothetical protein ANN_19271 [Periplaneta americana]
MSVCPPCERGQQRRDRHMFGQILFNYGEQKEKRFLVNRQHGSIFCFKKNRRKTHPIYMERQEYGECNHLYPVLRKFTKEHRLRVFENEVLRKIFGARRDEVTGEWRKLHNTELHALYSSPDIIRYIKSRRLRWARHVARMGESRNAYRVLVGRPEGKRPLGRPRRGWEDNIKMDLREVGYDDRDWINLAQAKKAARSEKTTKSEKTTQTKKAAKSEKTTQTKKAARSEKTTKSEKTTQTNETTMFEKAVKSEKTVMTEESMKSVKTKNTEKTRSNKKTTKFEMAMKAMKH